MGPIEFLGILDCPKYVVLGLQAIQWILDSSTVAKGNEIVGFKVVQEYLKESLEVLKGMGR